MKSRAILVDDEHLALERLERLLLPFADQIEIIGQAQNGSDAVELINRLKPDVVFLDIQMPELNGFDVLERLDFEPPVIFTTAFDQFALKAFDVFSVDYLLKPIDPARLQIALEKLGRMLESDSAVLRERVAQVVQMLEQPAKKRIQVKIGDKIKFIPVSEIVYFSASDKYVELHTNQGSHLLTDSLKKLENELPAGHFVRVHRAIIINLNFILEITKGLNGALEVTMKDHAGTVLPVSRRFRSGLNLGS